MLFCREFDGGVDWSKVREAMDDSLDSAGRAGQKHDRATWGALPEHVAAQERLMSRGGNVGDHGDPPGQPPL